MSPVHHVVRRSISALIVAAFVFCLTFGIPAFAIDTDSVKKSSNHEFKDPYDGGTRLPNGGGEPGEAYLTLLDAAAKKDLQRICGSMTTDKTEFQECLKDEKVAEGIIFWLGNPTGQKILDGYCKGDEATLDVAYPHAGSPDSYASVRMKKADGKWIWNGVSASGSGNVSAAAGGAVDLGTSIEPDFSPEECPMLGKWDFIGTDDAGETWTGIVDIRIEDGATVYDVNIQGPERGSGVGGSFTCNPDQRSFSCVSGGTSFTADLSEDEKSLTNGRWTTAANDFLEWPEVNGTWSATLQDR